MLRRAAILALLLLLAACGDTAPLRPAAGKTLPVKAAVAQAAPSADDLLQSTPMAHPERIDELVKKSQPRESDRFDLPPSGAAAPSAQPEDSQDATRVTEPQ